MNPLELLVIGAIAGSAGTLVARRGGHTAGSPLAAGLAAALGLVGRTLPHDGLMWASVALFVLWVLLPARLFRRARRRAAAGDLPGAVQRVTWALRLRPRATRLRAWRRLWQVADAWYAGDAGPAEATRVEWLADGQSALVVHLDALTHQWARLQHSPALDAQARALCELGQVEAGVELVGRLLAPRLGWAALAGMRGTALAPLAFAGERAAVASAARQLRLSGPVSQLWRGTAELAAGATAAGVETLGGLTEDAGVPAPVRRAAAGRLREPPGPTALGPAAQQVIGALRAELVAGDRLRARAPWRAPLTVALVLSFALMFAAEALTGGVTDMRTLLNLGALYRDGAGELRAGWRILTYGWLHYGWTHLLVNSGMVLAVGPVVEAGLGRAGAALAWVVAVVTGGLMIAQLGTPGVTVGASGGAMGWIGALVVLAILHPQTRGTRTAGAAARVAAVVLGLQILLDLSMPEISVAGHLGGLLGGALTAALWIALVVRRAPREGTT